MRRCPRCRSSMIRIEGGIPGLWSPTWSCLACGQEIRHDGQQQQDDDLIAERILRDEGLIVETRRRGH